MENPIRSEFAGWSITRTQAQWRHGSWRARRLQVWESHQRLNSSQRRQERFSNCGAAPVMERRDDGKAYRMVADKCRDRTCFACGCERAGVIAENLKTKMEEEDNRLVTLTLRHSHASLCSQIDRLYASFLLLRRRSFWLSHVKGGAAFLEIKKSERDGLWHPHLHLVIHGDYLSQKQLSREWLEVTGDSSYVYIKLIDNHEMVARYVTKYVTKPLDSTCFASNDTLDEAITGLRGRRLCLTFGSWRGFKLTDPPPDSHTWTPCESPDRLWSRIRSGEPGAAELAIEMIKTCPALERYLDTLLRTKDV